MTFTLIDVILIVFVVIFIVAGYVLGFVHSLGAFLGASVGIFIASRLAIPLGASLAPTFGGNTQVVTIVAFAIIYLIASRLFGFLFWMIEKSVGMVAKMPFLKSIDHLLGGLFGFLEGVIAVASVVYFAGQILPVEWLQNLVKTSQVGAWLLSVFDLVKGLVPTDLQKKISDLTSTPTM